MGLPVFEELDKSINIKSLKIKGGFLIDNKSAYGLFNMSDGTKIMKLEGIDIETFSVFDNTTYAKDKNYIYNSRDGIMQKADLKTFKPANINSEGYSNYGKDKNNNFIWGNVRR